MFNNRPGFGGMGFGGAASNSGMQSTGGASANSSGSGMELYRMLESYGLQIQTTEAQLNNAREQREAVLAEMGAARDAQEEARAQLDAVHAQAAHMEAERSSREVELQAVKARNAEMRTDINTLMEALKVLKEQSFSAKEEFVARCRFMEDKIKQLVQAES